MVRKINGFTLIELMIVITVVGILAAIAYPSYQQYVRKTKRVDAQGEMTALVGSLQRYKVVNMSYLSGGTAVTLSDLGHSGYIPQQSGALYKVELKNVTAGTWDIIATPVNAQEKDGALTVNSKGKRCWYEGKDDATGACTSW